MNSIAHYAEPPPAAPSAGLLADDNVAIDEEEFQRYYRDRGMTMTRVALGLGVLLVIAVCTMDIVLMPAEFSVKAVPIRILLMLSTFGGALAITFIARWRRWHTPAVTISALVSGIGTILIGAIAARSGVQFVQWAAIFITFYTYLVLGLPFKYSIAGALPIFLTYLTLGVVVGAPMNKLAYGTLFLLFSNLVGMYASFTLERNARQIYRSTQQLKQLAQIDGLTKIHNRRMLDEYLRRIWKQARRDQVSLALLIIDIDFFKRYNDSYGHQAGDNCLRRVAAVLSESVHRPLDFVARYGGEEFTIVLYGPTAAYVRKFSDDVLARIAKLKIEHEGSAVSPTVSVSIGAAVLSPDTFRSVDDALKFADDALYEAKARGRNKAVVYESGRLDSGLSDRHAVSVA